MVMVMLRMDTVQVESAMAALMEAMKDARKEGESVMEPARVCVAVTTAMVAEDAVGVIWQKPDT